MSRVDDICEGFDKLHHAIKYLSEAGWGVDTSPEHMKANVDARKIMIRLELELCDDGDRLSNSNSESKYKS